jgi:hypothetical protein
VELHYNGSISNGDIVRAGPSFAVGDVGSNFDELNLSAGFITQFANNLNLAVGAAAPLRTRDDRTFDYQVGVRASWFFGPTARARDAAAQVSSY